MNESVKEIIYYIKDIVTKGYIRHIINPFKEMRLFCSKMIDLLQNIASNPSKCEELLREKRSSIQPHLTHLLENFKGKYYTKSNARKDFANSSIEYLEVIDKILSLPNEPDSTLECNSFLTLIHNRSYFVIYNTEELSFLEKIIYLSNYYQKEIDNHWRDVCKCKSVLSSKIIK